MTDHPVRLPSEPALEARIAALLRSDRVLLAARDVAEIEYKKHADAGVSVGGSVTAATRAALDAALGAIFDELAALRVPAQEAPRYDLTPDELTRVERRADGIRADIQQQTDAFERSAQLSGEDRSIVVREAAPRAVEGAAEQPPTRKPGRLIAKADVDAMQARIAELEAALRQVLSIASGGAASDPRKNDDYFAGIERVARAALSRREPG